jgi:Tn3 transposase DDE domain
VNHHYGLELAKVFGGGTMSSSDGQRFPVRGKSLTSRDMVIHGGRVLSTYTHVSDQWSTYGTKILVPVAREAHFALDEFLGNATDLPITEHAADTHGVVVTWTPLVPLASLAPGCNQSSGDRAGRIRRCLCGYGSAVKTAPTGSTCSMRTVSRSRLCRGSCGSWRLGTARPTRWSPTPTTFVTCGGSST